MLKLVLGIMAAIGASSLYSLGVALQAMDAREVPAGHHLRISLVRQLVVRARWLAGTGLSILGWPLQVVALLLAPLVVVQPALAAGLLVLMLAGERMLNERAGRREYLSMLAIGIGVVGSGWTAPERTTTHTDALTLTLVLVGLGLLSLLPYLLSFAGRTLASVTMIGAGLGFAWSGVATKLASDSLAQHHLLVAAVWGLSTAGASAVGALSEMSALQERPAIQVAPVVFVTQTLVPVMLAPLLLGESFSTTPLGGVPLVASLLLLAGGAASLARSPLLVALMTGDVPDRVSEDSGSTPSPSLPSRDTSRSSPTSEESEPSSVTTTTSPARIGR
jgi:FtsH-binding integral membrane protein